MARRQPRGEEGAAGNSLLLRAISSQNKNISFRRGGKKRPQINTGFCIKRILFAKELLLLFTLVRLLARSLTHSIDGGMKDGS